MNRQLSERVIINSPLSFAGSAQRIWRIRPDNSASKVPLTALAVILISFAWMFVAVWYMFVFVLFGWLLVVPYRLLRRGARQRKMKALQHRELLAAIERQKH